jgi:hypothetical protein
MRLVRRLLLLGFVGGSGWAVWTAWQRSKSATPEPPTPTFDPVPSTASATASTPQAFAPIASDSPGPSSTSQTWVDPVDGQCPPGYPIKGNANSGIFHVPGGRFYDRTVPERCYASAEDAEADGYRRSKA